MSLLHTARFVEWRANCIRNPVSRLRYLRQAAGTLPKRPSRWSGRPGGALLVAAGALVGATFFRPSHSQTVEARPLPAPVKAPPVEPRPAHVWLVDARADHEIYSTGLRIETAHTVRTELRSWKRLNLATGENEAGGAPAGIVFHSTESHIAPFEASENLRLRRAGESVLEFVARNRSYHYLIDRFGRVHRIVDERDAAWHAGAAIWGDAASAWLNLNHSFLGVALEAATADGNGDRDAVTPAQIHALKTLTAMLRSRYSIPAERCVTHAQVSVNASGRLLGHHVDWASGFPFAAIGLPDNYSLPLASMTAFGFGYDQDFLAAGAAAWTGLAISERHVRRRAADSATSVQVYRGLLQERYRKVISRLARDKESN